MLKATFLQLMPVPLLTRDQVRMLRSDNVVAEGMPGLGDLGIVATAAEAVLPSYLSRFRKPGGLGVSQIEQV
jgi:NADH dehydrogenase